jgi:hypothetical protein
MLRLSSIASRWLSMSSGWIRGSTADAPVDLDLL